MREFIWHMIGFNLVVLIVSSLVIRFMPRLDNEYFRISWVIAWYGTWMSGLYLLFGG